MKEQNIVERVQLEYETNKNWINFREKKKALEQKNRDLTSKLAQSEEAYLKAAATFQEKSNQSYNYFEEKQVKLNQKQRFVSWLGSSDNKS